MAAVFTGAAARAGFATSDLVVELDSFSLGVMTNLALFISLLCRRRIKSQNRTKDARRRATTGATIAGMRTLVLDFEGLCAAPVEEAAPVGLVLVLESARLEVLLAVRVAVSAA